MRMSSDADADISAFELVNHASERQLSDIISQYGGERYHKLIAAAIISARVQYGEISTTE